MFTERQVVIIKNQLLPLAGGYYRLRLLKPEHYAVLLVIIVSFPIAEENIVRLEIAAFEIHRDNQGLLFLNKASNFIRICFQ